MRSITLALLLFLCKSFEIVNKESIIIIINRLRANHFNLNESLSHLKIVESPMCKCDEYEESIDHVIWSCSLYNEKRDKND